MTGFFLRLHLVAFFYFVFDFWVCGGLEIATLSLAMTGFFLGYTWLHFFTLFLIFGFVVVLRLRRYRSQ